MKIYLIPIFLFFVLSSFTQEEDIRIFGSEIEDSFLFANEPLPVVFDLRNSSRLAPVKTQPDGGCWTSAATGSVESMFRTFGYGEFVLSDINMKLFHGLDSTRSTNGNHFMATAYFSRGAGPVLKNPETDSLYCIAPKTAAYITDARFLPDNPSLIKNAIKKFGSVYSMMYFKKMELDTITNIYYTKNEKINHVIDLVGWNDTLSTKTGKGVWIAQNSLGEEFGDAGFFYVPYSDPNILKYNSIWNKWITYNSSSQIYYYDTLGTYFSYGYNDSIIYGLVRYTAVSNCEITKTGTSVNHQNTRIYAEIYKGFDEATGTLTGKSATIPERNCKYAGYYTFNLEQPVRLKKGEEFYILMRYIVPEVSMPMPVEKYVKGYSDPTLTTGKCWINHDINQWPDAWYETGENAEYDFLKFNLCIKVYCVDLQD
jgi:C1A family cysteine protease